MLNKSLIMLWATLLLAGCANLPVLTPLPASRTPTLRAMVTPTATPVPKPMPTATLVSRFTRQCLPVPDNEIGLKDVASGAILLVLWELP